jgi:nucleotide-binding universal stress UspA family protein
MAYKDILVHMDNSPQCEARLELALNLAKLHKAHLTGLYVISHPHYTPQLEGAELASTNVETMFLREAAKAEVSAGWQLYDCAVTGVDMSEIINMYAYYKDLVVVGQTRRDKLMDNMPPDLPERVVLGAGCPVLVVPFAGNFSKVGEHAMIAWHVGRESARALHDAMPFLENSQDVSLVRIGVAAGECGDGIPGASLCDYLSRHGIQAKMDNIIAEVSIGDVLLNHAWDHGCDLLVMGACSKTARGTLSISAVAKNALEHMSVPVLFSH